MPTVLEKYDNTRVIWNKPLAESPFSEELKNQYYAEGHAILFPSKRNWVLEHDVVFYSPKNFFFSKPEFPERKFL